jgi:hypothetical protein
MLPGHDNSFKIRKSEGDTFAVLHAGCSLGFLVGCYFLLRTKNNDGW